MGSNYIKKDVKKNNNKCETNTKSFGVDQENSSEYTNDGYCYVELGSVLKEKYKVVRKLGWGYFSTVWLCKSRKDLSYVAVKIVKSKKSYRECAKDEISLLENSGGANISHLGYVNVVRMLDHFSITSPHGLHISIVFEVLGKSLLCLLYDHYRDGIPMKIVKRILLHLFRGLHYLHDECKIIHTDIKPENVAMSTDLGSIQLMELETYKKRSSKSLTLDMICNCGPEVKIRHSTWMRDNARKNCAKGNVSRYSPSTFDPNLDLISDGVSGMCLSSRDMFSYTTEKKSLAKLEEVLLKQVYKIADLGNACPVDYHFSEGIQTREYRCPETIIGSTWNQSADIWASACLAFELVTGDYLFDPDSDTTYNEDDDHLAMMIELLGSFPTRVFKDGENYNKFFNKDGELRRIKGISQSNIVDMFRDKYSWNQEDALEFSNFLLPMLDWSYTSRPSAYELSIHPFLNTETSDTEVPLSDVNILA